MINSAMRLNETDLDSIGNHKTYSYRAGGTLVVVAENGKVAVVQGYAAAQARFNGKVRISDCMPTCIKARDLAGLAKAHYGHMIDAA